VDDAVDETATAENKPLFWGALSPVAENLPETNLTSPYPYDDVPEINLASSGVPGSAVFQLAFPSTSINICQYPSIFLNPEL